MVAKLRHLYEIIAGSILSFLGFTGCDAIDDIVYPKPEYGMPHAKFTIIGDVKAEDTGNPIKGIVVKFRQNPDEFEFRDRAEFKTDKDGKINATFTDWPEAENIELTFEDIDGEDNGGFFAPDTLRQKDLHIEFVEDKKSSWHKGDYTITFEAKMKQAGAPEQ